MVSTVDYGVLCWFLERGGCSRLSKSLRPASMEKQSQKSKAHCVTCTKHLLITMSHQTHTLGSTRREMALLSCSFALQKSGNVRHLHLTTAHGCSPSKSRVQLGGAGWPVIIWKVGSWAKSKAVLPGMNLVNSLLLQIQLLDLHPRHQSH